MRIKAAASASKSLDSEQETLKIINLEDDLRAVKEENKRLRAENNSQTLQISELKETVSQLKASLETQSERQKSALAAQQEKYNERIKELKEKQKADKGHMEDNEKFLKQVKTSYKRNESTAQSAENLIVIGKEFLLEHSVFLPSLAREVAQLKNSVLNKRLGDFRRDFDRLQIAFQKFNISKTAAPASKQTVGVHERRKSVEMSVKNRSFCSVSSVASRKLGNQSQISMSSAKLSVKSKGSIVLSRRSSCGSKTPKKGNPKVQVQQLERELNDLKAQYKKLIGLTSGTPDDDPLVRERLNHCANEIQRRTKQLIQARKSGQI